MKNRKIIRGGLRTDAFSRAKGKNVLIQMKTMEEQEQEQDEMQINEIMKNNLSSKEKLEQIANLVKNYNTEMMMN